MTDHPRHFGVAQFLCNSRALLWISRVVFGNQFKLDFLAANNDVLRVQLFNGHARAIFIVFAIVSLRTGHRCHMTNFDDSILR